MFDIQKGILVTLVTALCLFLVTLIADITFFTKLETRNGTVVGLEYSPSKVTTGIGVTTGQDTGNIVMVSSQSEKWTIILEQNGSFHSFRVTPSTFYSSEIGESILLDCNIGRIYGSIGICSSH